MMSRHAAVAVLTCLVATVAKASPNASSCALYPYQAEAWATCVQGAHARCTNGTEQSPIGFKSCEPETMPMITLHSGWTEPSMAIIRNTGYTFGLIPQPPMRGKMVALGENYTFLQCHFHYGSEHTVGGMQHDLEVHCPHVRDVVPQGGRTHAVLGRFFSTQGGSATDNAFFAGFLANVPAPPAAGESDVFSAPLGPFTFSDVMSGADMTHYWAYDGSRTTPDCGEFAQYRFLMDVGHVSSAQMEHFKTAIGVWEGTGNFRPPQPLHGRVVQGCSEEMSSAWRTTAGISLLLATMIALAQRL